MPPSSSTSPGSASPASREVIDWSPAKWAYYEEICHDILLPDWDDLTVVERREWEGMFKKMADGKKNERMGREKAKLVGEQGVRMGDNRQRGRAEDREGGKDGEDGEDGEEQDGGHGFDFEVDGVAQHAPPTHHTRKREAKDKHISIKPTTTIKDLEPTGMSLGRGSRKAKLQGDSKRREQMLEETFEQADEDETEDEDERPQPQPQRRKGKEKRGRERQIVEEYQPPRLQRRQAPVRFTSTITAPTSRYEFAYQQNRMYETQSDQDSLPSKDPSMWASPAPRPNFDQVVTGFVTGSERVYVSPYPALPARAPARAPGKGDVEVEGGGREELERDGMKIGGGLR